MTQTSQYCLSIDFSTERISRCQPRHQSVAYTIERLSVAQPQLIPGGAGSDLQRLYRGFLSRLQTLEGWRLKPPVFSSILGIRGCDVGKYKFHCLGHSLCRATRYPEFFANVSKTDASSS